MIRLRWWKICLIALVISWLVIIPVQLAKSSTSLDLAIEANLPSLKPHPLPKSLQQWHNSRDDGNYFDQVETTPLGYLIWSQFPIKIYVQKAAENDDSAHNLRLQQWNNIVKKAISEWNVYLPLIEVEQPELANIIVTQGQAEREIKLNPATGLYDIPRAIAAQTNYEFYLSDDNPAIVSHRITVKIDPSSIGQSLLATVRHELGHALGIWGHSTRETDALYFSQVRHPLPISSRDINTLKKIYQQPTRLGWAIK